MYNTKGQFLNKAITLLQKQGKTGTKGKDNLYNFKKQANKKNGCPENHIVQAQTGPQ